MYKTGEKPGQGVYFCMKCGQKIVLDDDNDTLPPCPRCGHTEFTSQSTGVPEKNYSRGLKTAMVAYSNIRYKRKQRRKG